MARDVIITPERRARIRGRVVLYWDSKRQRYIQRSWPKGNGGDTPARKAARDQFVKAVALIKNAAGLDAQNAYRCAKDTQFLPRDLLMKAAMGTLFEWTDTTGQVWKGLRVLQSDIEALLKSISNITGSILVNAGDDWVALLPGTTGQVLTIPTDSNIPEWLDPTGGGGGAGFTGWFDVIMGAGSTTLGAGYCSAQPFILPAGFTSNGGAMYVINAYTGVNVAFGLYADNGNVPGALLASGAFSGDIAAQSILKVDFDTPYTTATDKIVWIVGVCDTSILVSGNDAPRNRYWNNHGVVLPDPAPATSEGSSAEGIASYGVAPGA